MRWQRLSASMSPPRRRASDEHRRSICSSTRGRRRRIRGHPMRASPIRRAAATVVDVAGCAAVGAVLAALLADDVYLAALLVFGWSGVLISGIDLRTHLIPTRLLAACAAVAAVLVCAAAVFHGGLPVLVRASAAAAIGAALGWGVMPRDLARIARQLGLRRCSPRRLPRPAFGPGRIHCSAGRTAGRIRHSCGGGRGRDRRLRPQHRSSLRARPIARHRRTGSYLVVGADGVGRLGDRYPRP